MFGGACMSEKLDFYEVNIDYVKYLKQFDSRIPDVVYQNRNKFVCGTLFKINGLNFFAPVSSFNIKQNSNYVIEVGNVPVGSVRYSFMFPVPDSEIKQKVINNESDYQYRFLLRQELKYCNKNREVIQSKAKAIYHKALDKNTTYHKFCCDFQLLEEKCKEWIYDKTIVKHEKGIPMYKFSFQEKMTLLELTKDRHTIELFAIDHNEVIKNKATDKLKKLDEATKKISPVHEHLKKGINVPHKIYFANYHTTIRLELIKDNICYYKDELNNSIYVLERKDAHLPQVMQRMLEPYLKANEKNTNVYVLTDSELANSNYHNLLIEYQNYPERFDYVRKGLVTSSQKTATMEQQKQQLKEKQESQSKKQVYQQSLKDMQEVYDKIEKFNKEHKAPLGTEKYEYELYAYMKQNGLYVHLYEEYENGEFLKDFDYGLVTGTIYGYPDKELRLSESFEIWGKDGEYFGAYSKKDVMTKLDGLDAKQQEKTQSIDEEKDLELDEFEK